MSTEPRALRWGRKLPKPIILKDGRMIKTLAEARAVILGLKEFKQSRLSRQYATELLL
jgi:hypothetical protein